MTVNGLIAGSTSGTTDLGTYACAIGGGNLDVAAPCKYVSCTPRYLYVLFVDFSIHISSAQTLSIDVGEHRCDILYYRDENSTPCTVRFWY